MGRVRWGAFAGGLHFGTGKETRHPRAEASTLELTRKNTGPEKKKKQGQIEGGKALTGGGGQLQQLAAAKKVKRPGAGQNPVSGG